MIDNNIYEGSFQNDVFNGFGTLWMLDGTIFSGIFVDGKCPKIGRVVDQDIFEGEVEDFKPDGVGKMVHKNGQIYEGMF